MISSFRQDILYAFRSFSNAKGLVAAVVISIGLGIGANTTVFSLVNELLLRDVPVRDSANLFSITQGRSVTFSYLDWEDYRDVQAFEGVAAYCPIVPANMNAGGVPQRVWGQMVSGGYFNLLGVPLTMGRGILPYEDEVPLRDPVVVLGHGLWQRMGADPAIVGKPVRLSGGQYTVIGVAAPGFFGVDRGLASEFWAPLAMRSQLWPDIAKHGERKRSTRWIEMTARLKPGVSREQAVAALNVVGDRIAAEGKKDQRPASLNLKPAGQFPEVGAILSMLMTALSVVVGLVLLIACANVANLLLARAATRQREMGIRLSIGASRGRVIRQLLTESVLLSLLGAAFGFLIALPGTLALAKFQPPIPLPIRFDFSPDLRVLAYTTLLAVATGIVFGLAPALIGTRGNLTNALRTAGGNNGGPRGGKLGIVLVGIQVTLSLVLLIGSGLFLRSLQSAAAIDLGIRAEGVLMFSVDTKAQGYSNERTGQFFRDVDRRVGALPGVQSVSFSNLIPLSLASSSNNYGDAADAKAKSQSANEFMVGSRYFETMGIPIHAGRDFVEGDTKTPVALINRTMAAHLFGNANPIGRHVRRGGENDRGLVFEVIGVVGDAKAVTIGEEQRACIFRYFPSDYGETMSLLGTTIVVRSASDPARLAADVRRAVEAIDRDMAIFGMQPMTEHVANALMLPRVCAVLFGVFGGIGLVLAAVGLYGVVNYSVRTRTREIGIRLALGARPSGVAARMARQGLMVVCAGLIVGLGLSFALSRSLAALLWGITPTDAVTFIGVPPVLLGVALIAVLAPAMRAARLDPMSALRYE